MLKRSWRYMGPVLANAPDEFIRTIVGAVSWWLRAIAKTFEAHETIFLSRCCRVLAVDNPQGVDRDDPVGSAINQPIGQVTDALLSWWYRRSLKDGEGLTPELKPIFTEICDTEIDRFRHGRVLLAAHVIALYRVDGDWARAYLLLLFDWQRSAAEAQTAWEGFLWSPNLYRPLIEAIKRPFLDTAQHYKSLGRHAGQYAALLTFAALDPGDSFTTKELADATRALPDDGLHDAAQTLARAMEGAGEQRADYWMHRVLPYLRLIWPKSRERATQAVSESFAALCVSAQEAFPEALDVLKHWLKPLAHPDYAVHRLHKAGICSQFPEPALDLLNLVIGDQSQWPPSDLGECLQAIQTVAPQLKADGRFERLTAYLRRHG